MTLATRNGVKQVGKNARVKLMRDLKTLLYPIPASKFLAQQWQKNCLHVSGSTRRVREIALNLNVDSQHADDAAKILTRQSGPAVQAWYAGGEIGGFQITREHAHIYSAIKMTVYFEELPSLRSFADAVARDLNVPATTVVASAFVSRAGGLTRMHFDSNDNFTIQLSGRKRWRTARNRHVAWPTQNGVIGGKITRELAKQLRGPLPRAMPSGAEEFVLEPGGMLYVPRGCWHEVEALEDSLSINISHHVVSIADLLKPRLRSRVIGERDFRRAAFGGDRSYRQTILRKAESLLRGIHPPLAIREMERVLTIIADNGDSYRPRVARASR